MIVHEGEPEMVPYPCALLFPPLAKPVARGAGASLPCTEGAGRTLATPRRGVLLSANKGDPDLTRHV